MRSLCETRDLSWEALDREAQREKVVFTKRLAFQLERYNESVIDEDLPATEENCLGRKEGGSEIIMGHAHFGVSLRDVDQRNVVNLEQ